MITKGMTNNWGLSAEEQEAFYIGVSWMTELASIQNENAYIKANLEELEETMGDELPEMIKELDQRMKSLYENNPFILGRCLVRSILSTEKKVV